MKIFLFIFLFLCQKNFSQENAEKTIPAKADFFEVDNLGNIYIVKTDQIQKFSAQWQQVNMYSNKLLGTITAIDVTNPMKILVFYKNLSQVVFLDNTLSVAGETVSLENSGLELVTLVCSSVNNGIWAYDQRTFQLVRLDKNLKIIAQTGNIIQQTGSELMPNFLMEKNNWVYLNDTARGILVFDIFGTYSKTIPLKNIKSLQVIDNVLYYENDEKFFSFSTETLEEKEMQLPEKNFKQTATNGKKIFVLTENELKIYGK